jgi:hypothetical protein
MSPVTFRKATRQAVKLKIAVQGPSGSGKTFGALSLASALAPNGKVAVIDTENGSASLYGDRFTFDTLDLAAPYTTKRYIEAINAAVEAGYEVVVIDSLSHQWMGEGGILSRKEALDARPGSNSYTNWGKFTPEHELFKAAILNSPVHLIATIRAKQDYVLETNDKGKQQPKKVGMAPVQREGMEYEFSLVFELAMEHRALISKDRTGLFDSEVPVDLSLPATAKRITQWLATGASAAVVVAGEMKLPGNASNFDGWGGKALSDVPTDVLEGAVAAMREKDATKYSTIIERAGELLADRATAEEITA